MGNKDRSAAIKQALSNAVENALDTSIAAAAARLEQGLVAASNEGEDSSFLMFPFPRSTWNG